jgi:hypothetical protein
MRAEIGGAALETMHLEGDRADRAGAAALESLKCVFHPEWRVGREASSVSAATVGRSSRTSA